MFLKELSDDLRQGDVCYDWVFPRWLLTEYLVASDASGPPSRAVIHVLASGSNLPVMVLSHDCEIENPRNRIGLAVAPILPWPFGDDFGSDESLDLMRSKSLSPDSTYEYIQFFPVQVPEKEEAEPTWQVVDFSGMMSASPARKVVPLLKARKRLEMLEETRGDLKLKLAAFFGRD